MLHWSVTDAATGKVLGLWPKVIQPMIVAPLLGMVVGFAVMGLLLAAFHRARPTALNTSFRRWQLASAAWMSFSHGTNDAQKTMGIITLTLFTATTQSDAFKHLPAILSFLETPEFEVHLWLKIVCAITIAAGTAAGGWRIIHTLGQRMVRLQPIHGFAAQTTAAGIIQVASLLGMPLSTTHIVSAAIVGVGSTRRLNAVHWSVAERMVWAWVLTLPVTALLGYLLLQVCRGLGAPT